jgi:hypothetical protein
VFENRTLRRNIDSNREEVTGYWRKLHLEYVNNLCSSPDIITAIISRRMKQVGYLERMSEARNG